MTSHDLVRLSIAEHVCTRPEMYTANGSLSEVLALFDGYRFAVNVERHTTNDVSPIQTLDWLADEFGFTKETTATDRVAAVRARFESDTNAIEAMREHAERYRT